MPIWQDKRILIGASVAVLVALGLGLGLGLSGGSSPSSNPTGNRAAQAAATTVAPGAPGGTTPSSGTPTCTFADLTVSPGALKTAGGYDGLPVIFKNTGSRTCVLNGYPVVVGLSPSGQRVGVAVAVPGGVIGGIGPNGSPQIVTLPPGSSASATVEASSTPINPGGRGGGGGGGGQKSSTTTTTAAPAPCPTISTLTILLPQGSSSRQASTNLTDCYGFSVHPFVPGTSGSA